MGVRHNVHSPLRHDFSRTRGVQVTLALRSTGARVGLVGVEHLRQCGVELIGVEEFGEPAVDVTDDVAPVAAQCRVRDPVPITPTVRDHVPAVRR